MTPGQRIRQAREARKLSLRQAADLIGMGKSSLSEIENGDSKLPSSGVLFKMAEVLGVSPRWIIDGEDGELMIPTKREVEILSSYRDLPEQAKIAVESMIAALQAQPKK